MCALDRSRRCVCPGASLILARCILNVRKGLILLKNSFSVEQKKFQGFIERAWAMDVGATDIALKLNQDHHENL